MSELKPPKDLVEAMGEAYELMLERTAEGIEHLKKMEQDVEPEVAHVLAEAKEKAVELGELTREEADKVAEYLDRDLKAAGSWLADTGEELKDWLGMETALIGDRLLTMFIRAADQTSIELQRLRERAAAAEYTTGEIAGIGTLVCKSCGELLHFKKAGHIPPCPKCSATKFQRVIPG
jgi:rubrerythrin